VGRERTQNRTNVIRVVGISLALATLAWTFRGTEPRRIAGLLSSVGGAGALILLPQLLSLFVESVGWRLAFETMGRRLPLLGLFRARMATEALAQTLPMGVVFCESMKPVLLARNCGADLATSLSGMAARWQFEEPSLTGRCSRVSREIRRAPCRVRSPALLFRPRLEEAHTLVGHHRLRRFAGESGTGQER
jgi:hypothetical protein